MKVILSIKPEFALKIFDGTKKFEFRRSIFKNTEVRRVVVYASAPLQQVIGEFEIGEILKHDLETLWRLTKKHAGISQEYYESYFADKTEGYAIGVKNAHLYATPKCIKADFNLLPPQSFAYLAETIV
jgi:predicted transcriptional regulator